MVTSLQPSRRASANRYEMLLLFCLIWCTYGLFISTVDLEFYTLQQAGVEAIVDHGTYRLGLSSVELLKPRGDVFIFNDNILAAKQPGQFTVGALPYFIFSWLGITYARNYNLAAALVTWCSVSLLSALGCVCFHLLLRQVWGIRTNIAYMFTFLYGFATILFPYAGVLHHDALSAAYLMISFYLLEKGKPQQNMQPLLPLPLFTIGAGVLVGLTIFTSMLPAPVVIAFGLYVLWSRNFAFVLQFGCGVVIGLLPLFAYNFYYFSSPWTQANVAGDFADTFIQLKWANFTHHLNVYLGLGDLSIWKYNPILAIGILGALCMPKRMKQQQILLLGGPLLQIFYILNIETIGHCQYGPRYLLPVVPFMMCGLAGWFLDEPAAWLTQIRLPLLELTGLYSLTVNLFGAIGSTTYCITEDFAFIQVWDRYLQQGWGPFPLWPLCLTLLLSLITFVVATQVINSTQRKVKDFGSV